MGWGGKLRLFSQELATVWGNASCRIPRGGELGLCMCSVWRPSTTQTITPGTGQSATTLFRLRSSQHFSDHPLRPQSQTFHVGWKAGELIGSCGRKTRAADGRAGPRGGRTVRGDSGTPRSAQAAWAGNPGGVAARGRAVGGGRARGGAAGARTGRAGVRRGLLTRSSGRH